MGNDVSDSKKKPTRKRPKRPRQGTLVVVIHWKDKLRYPTVQRHGVIMGGVSPKEPDGVAKLLLTIDPTTVHKVEVFPERRLMKDLKGMLLDAKRIANGG